MPADISSGPAEPLISGWMADDPATTTAFSGKVPQSWARLSRATVTAPTRTRAHTMLVRLMQNPPNVVKSRNRAFGARSRAYSRGDRWHLDGALATVPSQDAGAV